MQPVADADIVRRWCRAGLDGLAAAREEIDALNVYPVPDGDTGTNLFLTMEAACAAVDAECGPDTGLREVAEAMARGALMGARGNSGIILAQMLRGVADVLSRPGTSLADGAALADALERASDSAYAAVQEPVEGTILSVARAAAAGARASQNDARSDERENHDAGAREEARTRRHEDRLGPSGPLAGLSRVALAAARSARAALAETPNQLEVLRHAGVVDAGGRGLTVLLDAFDTVLTGRRPLPAPRRVGEHHVPGPAVSRPTDADRTTDARSPAYEVMYLLDAPDAEIPSLRSELAKLGDSLVVIGGDGEWNVHVHADDAGAAIEAGLAVGRPHRISVNHLAEAAGSDAGGSDLSGRAVVAFAAGPGLAELFASAGAVVAPTPTGHRPSTSEILAAVGDVRAAEVVILPNERDAIPVAEAAAAELRGDGRRVAILPTAAQVQGLAAVAVHEPGRPFDADVVAMTTAAAHARHGAVTIAAREAVTMAGICRPGDVLGVVEGDFAVIGSDLLEVAIEVVSRMLAAGGELVTVVTGADAEEALADGVQAWVRKTYLEADTVIYDGGQPRYPLLLGVE
ncbi:DAK2 domain-containing protein [Phytoactinopolyspora halotolerans]|uniref:DAK2 domain-containing protein n=1 Tax=Phytoactinopolyspora halotolerans TaxID=1981512 RepID=A0A6L9SH31_9ACTN|nr:DAK2 domain-containing protein [Phytoactinopolyspora halotolerans]NEE03631.1 DAK2 domain-containing protein [Phytoactinopolyspora halotolerans]